jgi:sortase A
MLSSQKQFVMWLLGVVLLFGGGTSTVVFAAQLIKEKQQAAQWYEETEPVVVAESPEMEPEDLLNSKSAPNSDVSQPLEIPPEEPPFIQDQPELKPLPGIVWADRPKKGERIGTLVIPTIGLRAPILEGTDEKELDQGVGHHTNSVLPGERDNSVLAGHRNTAFVKAGNIREGDEVRVETREGTFIYRVKKMWVTDGNDRTVIVSLKKPVLRMYTCYPFDAIGRAKKRYVIESELVEIK